MQDRVLRLTALSSLARALQMFTLLGIVANWLVAAGHIPAIGIIAGSVTHAAGTLAEMAIVIFICLCLLGAVVHVQLGERLLHWSNFYFTSRRMLAAFLIGATLGPVYIAKCRPPWLLRPAYVFLQSLASATEQVCMHMMVVCGCKILQTI